MPLFKRLKKLISLFTLVLLVELLVGCASSSLKYSDDVLFSYMPKDALVYMCFPVDKNMELASSLVQASFPDIKEKNVKKIVSSLDTIYASLSKKDVSLVASGSFPTFALDFVLNKKNGWKKIKNKNEKFYESNMNNFELAFPSSSIAFASYNVQSMLDLYDNQKTLVPETNAEIFFDSLKQHDVISFYTDNLSLLLPSLEFSGLKLDFPFGMAKGFLFNAASEEDVYQFEADLTLNDKRLTRAAMTAIKIFARAKKMPISTEMIDDSTIRISGLNFSIRSFANIITSIIHSNQSKGGINGF